MITFKVNGEGDEITFDEQSLTFPEGLELEAQTGLGANKYLEGLADGSTMSTAALIWIGAVKHAAAQAGLPFRDAARQHPFTPFADALDVLATMRTVRRQAAPDPTGPAAAPDGSTEPTSPATSEQPPLPTASPAAGVPTSESSPSSSASAPGSGTS